MIKAGLFFAAGVFIYIYVVIPMTQLVDKIGTTINP
jgi:hypothetical protein